MNDGSTRELILESAQALAQRRGFNGFSYADVATELDIRKASIHYHFPSRHDLETELLERYREGFQSVLREIELKADSSIERLEQYAELYASTLSDNKICLAGMMASDIGALPEPLAPALSDFFEEQIAWLTDVMTSGVKSGELKFSGTPKAQASVLLAALQGGLLMANAIKGETIFKELTKTLIEKLH